TLFAADPFVAERGNPIFVAIVMSRVSARISPSTSSEPYAGAVSKCLMPQLIAASMSLAELRSSLPPNIRAQPNPNRDMATEDLGICSLSILFQAREEPCSDS